MHKSTCATQRRATVVVRAARCAVPAPPPVVAVAAAPAPADAPAAALPMAYDAALVGRRLEALWGPEGEEQWYRATVVAFMTRARDHVMHFDDGHVERVSLPADLSSLRLLDERVECCSCERCCCDGGAGQPLPLPCACGRA